MNVEVVKKRKRVSARAPRLAFSSGYYAAAKERLNLAEQFPQDERLDGSAWKAHAAIAACESRRADAASAAANAAQAIRHEHLDEGLAKGIREDLRAGCQIRSGENRLALAR